MRTTTLLALASAIVLAACNSNTTAASLVFGGDLGSTYYEANNPTDYETALSAITVAKDKKSGIALKRAAMYHFADSKSQDGSYFQLQRTHDAVDNGAIDDVILRLQLVYPEPKGGPTGKIAFEGAFTKDKRLNIISSSSGLFQENRNFGHKQVFEIALPSEDLGSYSQSGLQFTVRGTVKGVVRTFDIEVPAFYIQAFIEG